MFERTIKPMLNRIMYSLTGKWADVRIEYGILALAATIAVPLKLLFFYKLIGVSVNFFLVWLITAVLTWFLFASFKNKWIPAVIYLLLSILMFCDVTYSSFFNRYLSVNMLGAAGVLNDITASILDVIKPWFYLILADAILALAALTVRQFKKHRTKTTEEETNDFDVFDALIAETDSASGLESNEAVSAEPVTEPVEAAAIETQVAGPAEKSIATIIIAWVSARKKPVAALLIICLLVFNFSGSFLITSLSNQEIYSFHVKDIVNKLTGNTMAGQGNEYMSAITASYATEKDGPLFGVAKGRNLIVIQIESLQNLVINKTYNGQEITPNLNNIIQGNTVYFDHFYQQIGSGNTSDAEFATNNSIYGTLSSYTYKLFPNNYFKGLPILLKEKGYTTAVFHAHEDRDFWNRQNMYPSEGFDTYYGGIGGTDKGQYNMTEWMGWGLTDSEFFKQTVPYLKELAQPFYSFIITLSNHHPYEMLDKYKFIDLLPEDQGTLFGNYLNSAAYTDYALGQLIQQLKDEGLYDNSIIAFYGDHMGLPKTEEEIYKSVSRFIGKDYDFDTMMNIPLIITVPGADQDIHQTVSTTGGQLDFMPTVAYLMGFDSLDTIYQGHNLMTVDSGFVAEQTYMTKGSFFSDDVAYEMSRDGVFENGRAWNPKTGEPVPVKDCYDGYMKSMGLINTSEYILKNDALRKIYEENQNAVSVFSSSAAAEIGYPDEIAKAGLPDGNLVGTNSLEALNASYDAGYRNIEINVCWTEDKEAVMLSSWDELGSYFDTAQNSALTLEEFHHLKMKNNLTSVDYLDLISWIKAHPDVKIYARAERSEDYFMKCMESYASNIMDQFVAEVPGPVEYSGLYPSILNLEAGGGSSADQLITFIETNHIGAVVLSKEEADGVYKKILKADCVTYVRDGEKGLLTKVN